MCRSSVKKPMVWEKVVYRILYSFNASKAYQLSRPLHCDEQIDFNTDGADTWVASGFCDNLHGSSTKCLGFHLDSGEFFSCLCWVLGSVADEVSQSRLFSSGSIEE